MVGRILLQNVLETLSIFYHRVDSREDLRQAELEIWVYVIFNLSIAALVIATKLSVLTPLPRAVVDTRLIERLNGHVRVSVCGTL